MVWRFARTLGDWKARASSKDVVVAHWHSGIWAGLACDQIEQFWTKTKDSYQPPSTNVSQVIKGYPYTAGSNIAAASLSMLAQ